MCCDIIDIELSVKDCEVVSDRIDMFFAADYNEDSLKWICGRSKGKFKILWLCELVVS